MKKWPDLGDLPSTSVANVEYLEVTKQNHSTAEIEGRKLPELQNRAPYLLHQVYRIQSSHILQNPRNPRKHTNQN